MADNIYKKQPLGRISPTSTNIADPDRLRKSQPNVLPIQGVSKGNDITYGQVKAPAPGIAKAPQTTKTLGIQMYAKDRYAAMRIMRSHGGVAYTFSKPFKQVEDNPVLQMFISGKIALVNTAANSIAESGISLHQFDVHGAGATKPPDFYRDKSVSKRAR